MMMWILWRYRPGYRRHEKLGVAFIPFSKLMVLLLRPWGDFIGQSYSRHYFLGQRLGFCHGTLDFGWNAFIDDALGVCPDGHFGVIPTALGTIRRLMRF